MGFLLQRHFKLAFTIWKLYEILRLKLLSRSLKTHLSMMRITMQFCCCLLVLLISEHTSKGNGKTETFSFHTEGKNPQIHYHVICLNLVWTSCTAHNLTVSTPSSELKQEQ